MHQRRVETNQIKHKCILSYNYIFKGIKCEILIMLKSLCIFLLLIKGGVKIRFFFPMIFNLNNQFGNYNLFSIFRSIFSN